MTVQKVFVKNRCDGDGSNKNWPITFDWDKNHQECIKVYTRVNGVLSQTTNFTIQFNEDTGNYEVFYPAAGNALASGDKIIIARELPLQQVLNLVNQGPFFADDIEITFDEVVMMCQQLNERLGRSLKVGIDIDSDSDIDVTLPVPTDEKNYGLRMTKDGFQLVNDPSEVYDDTVAIKNQAEAARDTAKAWAEENAGASPSLINGAKSSKQWAQVSQSFANDASSSATSAATQAGVATTQAGIATQKATDISASAAQIETNKTDIAYLKNYVTPQMFGAKGDGVTDDTQAVQSAVNSGSNVFFPKGTYLLNSTIILPDEILLQGGHYAKSKIHSTANVAFKYQAPAGSWEYNAPCFSRLTIQCDTGIQYNDESKDCVDGSSALQGYVMRPYISEMRFVPNNSRASGSCAIHCVKCFNGVIEKNKINGFDFGIKFYGSDNSSIHDNRIFSCNRLLDIRSRNSFGSQTWIYNNDLMAWEQYAIYSTARSIYINHNYFEDYSEHDVVYVGGGFSIEMCSNKVDCTASSRRLVSINENLYNIKIQDNYTTGGGFPRVAFENDTSRELETSGSRNKKSISIKNNYYNIRDFERGWTDNLYTADTSMDFPQYPVFFNVNNVAFSPLANYYLLLLDYENRAIEFKGHSGGVGSSIYCFPINCKGKSVKVTIKAKAKSSESASLFYQFRQELQSGDYGSNTITLTNEWKEYVITQSTSSLNFLVLANDTRNDVEANRPIIRWIKVEYVA